MDILKSLVFGNLDDISVSTARKIDAKKEIDSIAWYNRDNLQIYFSLLGWVLLLDYQYGNILELTAAGTALTASVRLFSKIHCLTISRKIHLFLSSFQGDLLSFTDNWVRARLCILGQSWLSTVFIDLAYRALPKAQHLWVRRETFTYLSKKKWISVSWLGSFWEWLKVLSLLCFKRQKAPFFVFNFVDNSA